MTRRTIHDAHIIIFLHFIQCDLYKFMIFKVYCRYPGGVIYGLVTEQGIITYHINLVAISKMDNIIDGDIFIE